MMYLSLGRDLMMRMRLLFLACPIPAGATPLGLLGATSFGPSDLLPFSCIL